MVVCVFNICIYEQQVERTKGPKRYLFGGRFSYLKKKMSFLVPFVFVLWPFANRPLLFRPSVLSSFCLSTFCHKLKGTIANSFLNSSKTTSRIPKKSSSQDSCINSSRGPSRTFYKKTLMNFHSHNLNSSRRPPCATPVYAIRIFTINSPGYL